MRKGTRTSPKKTAPRSEVMKKAWATRRAKAKLVVADALAPRAEAQAINAVRDDWQRVSGVEARKAVGLPGHGEIVGGAEYQFAEEIAKLARKKGGKDAIQKLVTLRIARARAEGQNIAERGRTELMQIQHEAVTDKAVCSAIGAFEQQMKLFNGLPPSVVMSSYTICRMLDALNRAGYTADGKK